jgi:hypothetical protein
LHSREEAKRERFAYAALPPAHFDRNKEHAISGTGNQQFGLILGLVLNFGLLHEHHS